MLNRRRLLVVFLIAMLAVGAACYPWLARTVTIRRDRYLMEAAQAAMDADDYATAESYAAQVAARQDNRQARLLAGEAAMLGGRWEQALAYLAPELEGTDADAVVAICAAADAHFRLRHSAEAERLYRRALELDPQQVFAKRSLAHLLTLQGRQAEALTVRFELLQVGQVDMDDLLLLGNPRALIDSDEVHEFERLDQANPSLEVCPRPDPVAQQSVAAGRRVVSAGDCGPPRFRGRARDTGNGPLGCGHTGGFLAVARRSFRPVRRNAPITGSHWGCGPSGTGRCRRPFAVSGKRCAAIPLTVWQVISCRSR